ncbi:MAG: histidine phosphatase family protein [bacterium]
MILYLVRHGESLANKKLFHHRPETPLSKRGVEQAKIVAGRLKNIEVDFIYSSPQKRAKQTAEIISKQKNLPVEFWGDLKEIRVPSKVWGKPLDDKEAAKIDEQSLQSFITGERYSDEETFEELSARGQSVLDHLLKEHQDRKVLCISHGTMTKMIVARILFENKLTPKVFVSLRKHLWANNTGITICEYTEKYGWTLNTWNDSSHL